MMQQLNDSVLSTRKRKYYSDNNSVEEMNDMMTERHSSRKRICDTRNDFQLVTKNAYFWRDENITAFPLSGEWTWWLYNGTTTSTNDFIGRGKDGHQSPSSVIQAENEFFVKALEDYRYNKMLVLPENTPIIDDEYLLWSRQQEQVSFHFLDQMIVFQRNMCSGDDVSTLSDSQGFSIKDARCGDDIFFAWEQLQDEEDEVHSLSQSDGHSFDICSFIDPGTPPTVAELQQQKYQDGPSTPVSVCNTDPVAFCEMSNDITALEGELQSLINEDLLDFLSSKMS